VYIQRTTYGKTRGIKEDDRVAYHRSEIFKQRRQRVADATARAVKIWNGV